MFFLVPRIAVILFVSFGLVMAWRALRPRRSRGRRARRRGGPLSPLPLVPAELLRGAERTWVVFTTPGREPGGAIAASLRASEASSQVTEVDPRAEPLLAEAYGVRQLPAVLLANRYGQVEARLVGWEAIESALPQARGSL